MRALFLASLHLKDDELVAIWSKCQRDSERALRDRAQHLRRALAGNDSCPETLMDICRSLRQVTVDSMRASGASIPSSGEAEYEHLRCFDTSVEADFIEHAGGSVIETECIA